MQKLKVVFAAMLLAITAAAEPFVLPGVDTSDAAVSAAASKICGENAKDCIDQQRASFSRLRYQWQINPAYPKYQQRILDQITHATENGITNWYFAALATGNAPAIEVASPSNAGSGSTSFCQAEWPSDFSMQEYCVKRAREGASSYDGLALRYKGKQIAAAIAYCRDEWATGNGQDWSMTAYCAKRQAEAYERLR